jgi:hypothetical protein
VKKVNCGAAVAKALAVREWIVLGDGVAEIQGGQGQSNRIKPNQACRGKWTTAAKRRKRRNRCFQWNTDGLFTKALNEPSSNPEGIESISPATWTVARVGPIPRGLPWIKAFKSINPEWVAYQALRKQMQPFQGRDLSESSPRVARSSQPWAKRFNPFGIGRTNFRAPTATSYSTENSEEPLWRMFARVRGSRRIRLNPTKSDQWRGIVN